jgi:hypothetical protein
MKYTLLTLELLSTGPTLVIALRLVLPQRVPTLLCPRGSPKLASEIVCRHLVFGMCFLRDVDDALWLLNIRTRFLHAAQWL